MTNCANACHPGQCYPGEDPRSPLPGTAGPSNGPLIPEIHEAAPHAQYAARAGDHAWTTWPVSAVKATGKKQSSPAPSACAW